jgi:hypothetical protein
VQTANVGNGNKNGQKRTDRNLRENDCYFCKTFIHRFDSDRRLQEQTLNPQDGTPRNQGLRHKPRHKRLKATHESDLSFQFANEYWLPTLDTLRNFFYALTADMKLTFELLRQGPLAG